MPHAADTDTDYETWARRYPDEAAACDLAWLEDNGSDLMDAVCDNAGKVLNIGSAASKLEKFAALIEGHRELSIGSFGVARARQAWERDARLHEALRIRWAEARDKLLEELRIGGVSTRADALGRLLGMLQVAGIEKT